MTPKKTSSVPLARRIQILAIGALCVVSSFSLGVRTAGDVQTIAPSEAGGIRLLQDINNDGMVSIEDVIIILEIVQGYEVATSSQLQADPNSDGRLTIEDAMRILQDLKNR